MTTTQPALPAGRSWKFARTTAPFVRALAGRRLFPLWAVVHHRGRRTGRDLSLPVALVAHPEVFVVGLPWGPRTNWVQNVLAAGGCVVRWKGADHQVVRPQIADAETVRQYYSRTTWAITSRFQPQAFLLLHR